MIHILIHSAIVAVVFGAKIGNAPKRVIGGSLANIENYPFYAYIAYDPSNSILCGGTIIQPDLILTAAHCLVDEDFKVYVGISNTHNLKYTEGYQVKHKIKYPGFVDGKAWFDLALLKLERNVTLGPTVKTISLASSFPQVGQTVIAVGFGDAYCNRSTSNVLQCVKSDHLKSAELKIKRIGYRGAIETLGVDQNICHGDSGGPIIYNNEVVGVSASAESVICEGGGNFAPVLVNSGWIRKHMKPS